MRRLARERHDHEGGTTPSPTASPAASPAGLLGLQRRAGNAAVVQLLRSSPPDGTVQRSLGFEFEVNVPAVAPGPVPEGAPPEQQETYAWVTGGGFPADTELYDRGYDTAGGFRLVTDTFTVSDRVREFQALYTHDRWVGGQTGPERGLLPPSILEWKTAPLDECGEGWEKRFEDQIDLVQQEIVNLRSLGPAHRSLKLDPAVVGVPQRLGAPQAGDGFSDDDRLRLQTLAQAREEAVRDDVHFRIGPQATVGIDLTNITPLLEPEERGLVSGVDHLTVIRVTSRLWDGLGGRLANVMDELAGANNFVWTDDEWAAVRGFVKMLLSYVVGNVIIGSGIGTGTTSKNLTPFWSKTDFALYRRALPGKSEECIKALVNVLTGELIGIHNDLRDRYPLREDGHEPLDVANFVTHSLLGEQDGVPERRLNKIDDLSSLGPNKQGLPVELRSIPQRPEADKLVAFALEIVRTMRAYHGLPPEEEQ